MNRLAPGIGFIDLQFLGRPRIIATAVLDSPAGVALVDPGPSTTLETLRASLQRHGISVKDLVAIVLTHIHLDHAGATGVLVKENPRLDVFVHERGARHLIDPSRLLDSATRLYGAEMDRLWGIVEPVPSERIRSLGGGERIEVAGRRLEVAYTPGHAYHHVSYFDRDSGVAFVGDTGGIRIGATSFVMPPTPPPDVDLDSWKASVDVIHSWHPGSLFLTHFGPSESAAPHLQELLEQLAAVSEMVRASLEVGENDEARFRSFSEQFGRHLRRFLSEEDATTYERAAPIKYNWEGLARYWRKRQQAA